MKISIIIPNFYPAVVYGGWVFSSLHTCQELSKLGVESYVSTTNDNGETVLPSNAFNFKKIQPNISVKYYGQTIRERISLSMVLNLWRDIKLADVVHIQGIFSAPTPLGLIYSRIFRKPVLLSPHGCMGPWCLADGSKFKGMYLRWLIQPFANKILWHATSDQEKIEILGLYPEAEVVIIPNGVNVDEFSFIRKFDKKEFVKKYVTIDFDPSHVLITMSRLHKKKGLNILLDSFSIVLKNFPHSVLLIAGEDFGEKAKLESQIKELGLSGNVFFIGHIKDQERVDFFGNADIFVLPSHNENFGLVFAEAMAAGTPVVASQNTPWQEVEQFGIGKWVENTPQRTADAIIDLLQSDLTEKGKKSKEFIEQNYSWKSVGVKFKKLFEDLVKS